MSITDIQPCECSEQSEMSMAVWMECHKLPIGYDEIFIGVG